MNEAERPVVRVHIFGEEYAIRSEMGEEYTRECARHVDEAIQAAHLAARVPEPHKAAILAALQITDEMMKGRAEAESLTADLGERLTALRERVEEAIEGGGSALRSDG